MGGGILGVQRDGRIGVCITHRGTSVPRRHSIFVRCLRGSILARVISAPFKPVLFIMSLSNRITCEQKYRSDVR